MFNRNKRFTAAQFSDPLEQTPDDLSGTLLEIQPHPENNGMEDAAGLLQALYDPQESTLGRNKSAPCSFELWFHEGSITFYLYAPTEEAVEKYKRRVANAYTNTAVTAVEGSNQHSFPEVEEDDYVAGGRMYPQKTGRTGTYYPIRHFRDDQGFEEDPYGQITSALLSTDESKVVVQVVFKAAARDWTDGGMFGPGVDDVAEKLRSDNVVWDPIPRDRSATSKEKQAAKIVENQRNSQAFHTNIRVAAISPEKGEAESRAKDLCGMFSRYYNATVEQGLEQDSVRAATSGRRARKLRTHIEQMQRRNYADAEMILTTDELAGIAHIPNGDEKHGISTPKIDWRHAQRGEHVGSDSGRHDDDDELGESGQAVGDD